MRNNLVFDFNDPLLKLEWKPKIVDRLYALIPNDVIRMILVYLKPSEIRSQVAGLSRAWYYNFYLDDRLWKMIFEK
jgi:hypothetical protein